MNSSIVNFENVSKIYYKGFFRKRIVGIENLSFAVTPNRITGFVGPNGAGKTTCLKLLMGFIKPTAGTLTLNGKPAGTPASRKDVAFLTEQPYWYDYLTVRESCNLIARISAIKPPFDFAVTDALKQVDLLDAANKKTKELSKGMQQRLGLAAALLGNPGLYVLDEPMSGLDPVGRRMVRAILRQLIAQHKTVLLSTHILEDISALCDDIIVLAHGKCTYQGAVSQLLQAGIEGVDIMCEMLPGQVVGEAMGRGYVIDEPYPGMQRVFVKAGSDHKECLAWCGSKGIYADSVTPRARSLEEILYKKG